MSQETDIKTALAVDNVLKPEDIPLITLSTGVVLRGKKPPMLTMIKVMAAFPRPKPPIYFSKEMGRDMENPDDPEYHERIKAWKTENGDVTLNAMILLATELVSVPAGMEGPYWTETTITKKAKTKGEKAEKEIIKTPPEWLKEYQFLNLPMHPDSTSWLYLTWVTFKAAINKADIDKIKEVVGRNIGILEKDVEAAEDFPGSNDSKR
jgi:hypothetical protein